jgi:hypothetical protein
MRQGCFWQEQSNESQNKQSKRAKTHGIPFSLQIFGDFFEFLKMLTRMSRIVQNAVIQTVVDVILHKGALCGDESVCYRLHLLRCVKAWRTIIHHGDDFLQVSMCPFQAQDNIGVGMVGTHRKNPMEGDRLCQYGDCGYKNECGKSDSITAKGAVMNILGI